MSKNTQSANFSRALTRCFRTQYTLLNEMSKRSAQWSSLGGWLTQQKLSYVIYTYRSYNSHIRPKLDCDVVIINFDNICWMSITYYIIEVCILYAIYPIYVAPNTQLKTYDNYRCTCAQSFFLNSMYLQINCNSMKSPWRLLNSNILSNNKQPHTVHVSY